MTPKRLTVALFAAILISAGPTTVPVHNLQDVDENYQSRLTFAQSEYEKAMVEAAKEREKGLKQLQDNAMKASDLDKALSIKKRIEEIDAEATPGMTDTSQSKVRRVLETKLAGTKWHDADKGGPTWVLRKDGILSRSDGVSGEWAATSAFVILIHLNAEGADWVDRWKFSDDLKSFTDANAKLGSQWNGSRQK